MSEQPESPAPAESPAPRAGWPPLARRAVWAAVALVALIALYFILAAFIPRWWAQRIGDQVDGSGTAGVGLGLFYGFVFTFLPLVALWLIFRRRRHWKTWLVLALAALLLAGPNIVTLGIVIGTGDSAHAAERTLDVEAPAFRAATLVGAILGALAVAGVRYMLDSRKRHKTREAELRTELRTRDEAAKAAAAAQGDEAPKD